MEQNTREFGTVLRFIVQSKKKDSTKVKKFGFLLAADGKEVYFHPADYVGDEDRRRDPRPGDSVSFVRRDGGRGMAARRWKFERGPANGVEYARVNWFNRKMGYGYACAFDDRLDIYIHQGTRRAIEYLDEDRVAFCMDRFETILLQEGDTVAFIREENNRGLRALVWGFYDPPAATHAARRA